MLVCAGSTIHKNQARRDKYAANKEQINAKRRENYQRKRVTRVADVVVTDTRPHDDNGIFFSANVDLINCFDVVANQSALDYDNCMLIFSLRMCV
jgi:hypothetical protein